MTKHLKQHHAEDEMRPITLYISRVGMKIPTLNHMYKERLTVIDIELGTENAKQLHDLLGTRLEQELRSGIRIRLYGRLVLT